jgi:hypothetical protein
MQHSETENRASALDKEFFGELRHFDTAACDCVDTLHTSIEGTFSQMAGTDLNERDAFTILLSIVTTRPIKAVMMTTDSAETLDLFCHGHEVIRDVPRDQIVQLHSLGLLPFHVNRMLTHHGIV